MPPDKKLPGGALFFGFASRGGHGLQRTPQGWRMIRQTDGNATDNRRQFSIKAGRLCIFLRETQTVN